MCQLDHRSPVVADLAHLAFHSDGADHLAGQSCSSAPSAVALARRVFHGPVVRLRGGTDRRSGAGWRLSTPSGNVGVPGVSGDPGVTATPAHPAG